MDNKKKTIFALIGFALFIILASVAYNFLSENSKPTPALPPPSSENTQSDTDNSNSDASSSEPEKIKAPDFTVVDADGNSVKLSELFGKPIVLNFWASWCPPCKDEMPDFDKVYTEMGDDIVFAMVNMVDGQRETLEKGEKFITDNEFTFPVYYDTEQDAAMTYSVSSLPTTYFIDKDGYIVTAAQGGIDEETLLLGISYINKE